MPFLFLPAHDFFVQEDELMAGISKWQEVLGVHSRMSPLLEERNRTGRTFGSDAFYAIVAKMTGCDTRPAIPGRPSKKQ